MHLTFDICWFYEITKIKHGNSHSLSKTICVLDRISCRNLYKALYVIFAKFNKLTKFVIDQNHSLQQCQLPSDASLRISTPSNKGCAPLPCDCIFCYQVLWFCLRVWSCGRVQIWVI